jgi:hypothetical protein
VSDVQITSKIIRRLTTLHGAVKRSLPGARPLAEAQGP